MEEDLTLEALEALKTEENLPKLSIFAVRAQNGTRLPPLSYTVGLAPSGPHLAQNAMHLRFAQLVSSPAF